MHGKQHVKNENESINWLNLIAFSTKQDTQSSKKKQFKFSAIGPSLLPWSFHCGAGLPVEMRNENQLRLCSYSRWATRLLSDHIPPCALVGLVGLTKFHLYIATFSTPSRWSLPCTLRTKVLNWQTDFRFLLWGYLQRSPAGQHLLFVLFPGVGQMA